MMNKSYKKKLLLILNLCSFVQVYFLKKMDFEFLKSIITRGKIQLKKTKGKQICLHYPQLKNIQGIFRFDYTVLFRRQINNYSTQKIYISF